ncbi:MAG: 23S rRNA (adenine(2503)-C(2))-methyltransferase RlmN [Desulfobacterota bacterium]|nr:23S rRNA (adenine(2503)-C(2))-methyltransferase RlmN [Thermodesulfobacteriota bacterium]
MTEKIDLKNLSPSDLEGLVATYGKERYRATQILKWLYHHGIRSLEGMTNLSKTLRHALGQRSFISSLHPLHVEESRDGTKKFLFQLEDGHRIESVLIPDQRRLTLCISTQVGCAMGCRFCLTGRMGFKRNLTTAEMVNQILAVKETLPEKTALTNIVLMGMGEPLANYENTLKAIRLMTHPEAFNYSSRRVTLSTVGLIPELERLSHEEVRFRLALSLNATDEETRSRLMPINRRHPLSKVLELCRRFPLPPRARITFEYVLIRGENDSIQDAKRLVKLLKGIPSKVNLIPLNEAPGIPFKRPSEETLEGFQKVLLESGLTAIVRKSKGSDISAACGQLQGKFPRKSEAPHRSEEEEKRGCDSVATP